MISLFLKSSLTVLQSLSFTKTLYAFDFDGTLAPIVTNHADARMQESTEHLLKELSQLVSVAIISGRSRDDLQSRFSFTPQYLIGNHGLEFEGVNPEELQKARAVCDGWIKQLQPSRLNEGVSIENKGYSLAIHHRQAANLAKAKNEIQAAVLNLSPAPRIVTGKAVVNILPPDSPNKGDAILRLLQMVEAKYAFYIGDDDTDEDIFKLPYHSGQIMTVRVGDTKVSKAKFYISEQTEIDSLLSLLVGYHRK